MNDELAQLLESEDTPSRWRYKDLFLGLAALTATGVITGYLLFSNEIKSKAVSAASAGQDSQETSRVAQEKVPRGLYAHELQPRGWYITGTDGLFYTGGLPLPKGVRLARAGRYGREIIGTVPSGQPVHAEPADDIEKRIAMIERLYKEAKARQDEPVRYNGEPESAPTKQAKSDAKSSLLANTYEKVKSAYDALTKSRKGPEVAEQSEPEQKKITAEFIPERKTAESDLGEIVITIPKQKADEIRLKLPDSLKTSYDSLKVAYVRKMPEIGRQKCSETGKPAPDYYLHLVFEDKEERRYLSEQGRAKLEKAFDIKLQ